MSRPILCAVLFLALLGTTISCDLSNVKDKPKPDFPCKDGMAKEFACENVDLFAHLPIQELTNSANNVRVNDIWGWTDPQSQKEYALVGLTNGISLVDISDPNSPVVLGVLPEVLNAAPSKENPVISRHDDEGKGESAWRDIKTYSNHAFIVSDAQPHGLQVFDLTKLRDADSTFTHFEEDAHYSEFGRAHNIAINEETGFAYVVGSNTYGGGLHIIDIQNPLNPQFAGFHADTAVGRRNTGYVHDTQCVIYHGPDADYRNRNDEICFNSSETHLAIANVSDKENTYTISASDYEGRAYAHQGWLTEDHRFFLLDDELDYGNTTTYIWDVQDLDNPQLIGTYVANNTAIDHNQYIKRNYVYQSNYTSGLRILDISDIEKATLEEVAWFDTYPLNDNRAFDGTWSNYPFFDSGVIIVSDMSNGLFILWPNLD